MNRLTPFQASEKRRARQLQRIRGTWVAGPFYENRATRLNDLKNEIRAEMEAERKARRAARKDR